MMSNIHNKYIYYLNSRDRLTGTDNNFSMRIPLPPNNDFDSVICLQLAIPKSYYLIESGYNTFTFNNHGTNCVITLPPGNYTKTAFITMFNTACTSAVPSISGNNLTITGLSQSTGKWTYHITGSTSLTHQIILNGWLAEKLGFDRNSTNTFIGDTLISENVVKLQQEDTLFLLSDMVDSSLDSKGCLQEIFTNTPDYATITYLCQTPELYVKRLAMNRNNTYWFSLVNENNKSIQLNGLNMVLTLCFFKSNDIDEIHRENILIKNLEKMNK